MAEQNPDKGMLFLFPNQYKKEDKHPYLTGNGELHVDVLAELSKQTPNEKGMVEIQCAAWRRTSKGGKDYQFVTFGVKETRGSAEVPNPSGEAKPPNPDEDIPF